MSEMVELENKVIEILKTVFDPEIPVDIFELGLIYEIKIDDDANVHVIMTLTSPSCPVAETLPAEVETKVKAISSWILGACKKKKAKRFPVKTPKLGIFFKFLKKSLKKGLTLLATNTILLI